MAMQPLQKTNWNFKEYNFLIFLILQKKTIAGYFGNSVLVFFQRRIPSYFEEFGTQWKWEGYYKISYMKKGAWKSLLEFSTI